MPDVLESVGWRPRDLVGPDSSPKLTSLEDNIELAIKYHRHGRVLRVEGDVPVYEADPIRPDLVPIDDSNNPENLTLAQHMQDESIHVTSAEVPPAIRVLQCSVPLNEAVDTAPDYENGNITSSWVNSAVPISSTRPEQNRGSYPLTSGSMAINDLWTPWFQGCQQRFLSPDAFEIAKPKFGRVFQTGYYSLSGSTMTLDSPMPTRIAFDYVWFPYRTWFMLFQSSTRYNNYSFDRVVAKRYRTQTFPDGYRVSPGSMQIYSQLRQQVGASITGSALDAVYWPQRSWDGTGTPGYVTLGEQYRVPRAGEYDDDPTNMIRNYVGNSGYRRPVCVTPDFSTFETAQNLWTGGTAKLSNVWDELRSRYYAPNPGNPDIYNNRFFDWMLPINAQDSYSFRLLHEQQGDNQIDLIPLSMCGFVIILPYGYLPLYHKTLGGSPDFAGNDIGTFWARAPLHMAEANQSITWVAASGSADYLVPMLVSDTDAEGNHLGDRQWGYPYPKDLSLDVMLIGPDN